MPQPWEASALNIEGVAIDRGLELEYEVVSALDRSRLHRSCLLALHPAVPAEGQIEPASAWVLVIRGQKQTQVLIPELEKVCIDGSCLIVKQVPMIPAPPPAFTPYLPFPGYNAPPMFFSYPPNFPPQMVSNHPIGTRPLQKKSQQTSFQEKYTSILNEKTAIERNNTAYKSSPVQSVNGCFLFVGNIPFSSSYSSLLHFLRRDLSGVERVELQTNHVGESRGFAIVTVKDEQTAVSLIELYDGTEFEGRKLTIRRDRRPPFSQRGESKFGLHDRNHQVSLPVLDSQKEAEIARELVETIRNLHK